MQITEALIRRFLSNEGCSPEEADLVTQYFIQNPDRLNDYLGDDWDDADNITELHHEESGSMLGHISEEVFGRPADTGLGRRYLIGWIAAALVILIAGIGLIKVGKPKMPVAVTKEKVKNNTLAEKTDSWKMRVNNTNGHQRIELPDGSVITLFTQGRIRYQEPFQHNERKVILEGRATFEVVKDISAPFVVTSGAVTTTVLGTTFNVSENKQGVIVKLYKGKVSVRATRRDMILSPGEQIQYHAGSELMEVSSIEEEVATPEKEEPQRKNETIVFDNTPLPEVMKKLIRKYHMPIQYDSSEIGKMFFTGPVLGTDSLTTILRVIGNMNDLTILPKENGYIISASPKQ
jgi:ferric-dicitrate binding protein FerR (iron transport regulator)